MNKSQRIMVNTMHRLSSDDSSICENHISAARISRRGLLLGGGLSAASMLCCANDALAQPRVELLPLTFADQKRAADSLSAFQHSYSLFALTELYLRKYDKAQENDLEAMRATSAYLRGTFRRQLDDAEWLAGQTREHPKEFETVLLSVTEQSPIQDAEKTRIIMSFRAKPLDARMAMSTEKARSRFDGIEKRVDDNARAKGVPDFQNDEDRSAWTCMLLHSMLSGALAAFQWYLVPGIMQELGVRNCLSDD